MFTVGSSKHHFWEGGRKSEREGFCHSLSNGAVVIHKNKGDYKYIECDGLRDVKTINIGLNHWETFGIK